MGKEKNKMGKKMKKQNKQQTLWNYTQQTTTEEQTTQKLTHPKTAHAQDKENLWGNIKHAKKKMTHGHAQKQHAKRKTQNNTTNKTHCKMSSVQTHQFKH